MKNIYKSPGSEFADVKSINISTRKKIVCTICVLPPALLYFGFTIIIPSFVETFAAFGSDLPGVTLFVIKIYPAFIYLSVLSLIPVAVWLNLRVKHKLQKILFIFSLVNLPIAFIMMMFVQWAMYAPIAEMGEVI